MVSSFLSVVLLDNFVYTEGTGLSWDGSTSDTCNGASLLKCGIGWVIGISIAGIIFGAVGMIASAATDVAKSRGFRRVGFRQLISHTFKSTDFALSVLFFPFVMVLIVKAILESDDLLLSMITSFQTGFVIKSFASSIGSTKTE